MWNLYRKKNRKLFKFKKKRSNGLIFGTGDQYVDSENMFPIIFDHGFFPVLI